MSAADDLARIAAQLDEPFVDHARTAAHAAGRACRLCGHVHDPEDGRCDAHAHVGLGACPCPGEGAYNVLAEECRNRAAWAEQYMRERDVTVAERDSLQREVEAARAERDRAIEERDTRQAAIDRACDAAHEFEMDAANAIVCALEWLEPYMTAEEALTEATDGSTKPEPPEDGIMTAD